MGMFDYVRVEYPIDAPQDIEWQTKSMPALWMDTYVISKDGRILHEEYDLEDHSDPNAEPGSFESFAGCMTRVNRRLVEMPDFRGEIRFYGYPDRKSRESWWEYSALFKDGRLIDIKRLHPAGDMDTSRHRSVGVRAVER